MRNGGDLFCLEVGRTGIGRNRNAEIGRHRLHHRSHHLESRIVLARITDSVEFRSGPGFFHVIRSFPTTLQMKQYTKKAKRKTMGICWLYYVPLRVHLTNNRFRTNSEQKKFWQRLVRKLKCSFVAIIALLNQILINIAHIMRLRLKKNC